jgi:hypothetical protein
MNGFMCQNVPLYLPRVDPPAGGEIQRDAIVENRDSAPGARSVVSAGHLCFLERLSGAVATNSTGIKCAEVSLPCALPACHSSRIL